MPITGTNSIDFTRLVTPAGHGEVLVEPEPSAWGGAAESNRRRLDRADVVLLGVPLGVWRGRFRSGIGVDDHRPIVGLGHQPEFIHPGVWAKHVVASRAAQAWNGVALNLLVDSDEVRQPALEAPVLRCEQLVIERFSLWPSSPGVVFEQLRPQPLDRIAEFRESLATALGPRFEAGLMPAFLDQLEQANGARDWVGQMATARAALEALSGIQLLDVRVSETWCNPVLLDIVQNAAAFAASYNRALADYRRAYGVRGTHRPMPDLELGEGRVEVALWAFRATGPRRRVFVGLGPRSMTLYAERDVIAQFDERFIGEADASSWTAMLGDWRLRPRALALTLWARLVACDFFVHGIGGAKYDRISDAIMADYYGVEPPQMGCVSATLQADPTRVADSGGELRRVRAALRDIEWNPQRLDSTPDANTVIGLAAERMRLVTQSSRLAATEPRNRAARRQVFQEIRQVNGRLAAGLGGERERLGMRLAKLEARMAESEVARGREFFFALYDRADLKELRLALPPASDFAVY